MSKVLALVASTVISLGAYSIATANGTVKETVACPKPIHHKHHHKHQAHPQPHCEPVACTPCPSLHSGIFGGLKGGYALAKGKLKLSAQETALGNVIPDQHTDLGIGGGEIGLFLGYDHYFLNCWMLGIEAGAQWSKLSGKANVFSASPAVAATSAMKVRLKTDWTYDVALRLGRKFYECSLWYVKAGAQFTHFKLNASDLQTNTAFNITNTGAPSLRKHKYRTGILVGLGAEIPVACNWSFGTEYNFTWYQQIKKNIAANDGSGDFLNVRIRPFENQFLARLIWKQ